MTSQTHFTDAEEARYLELQRLALDAAREGNDELLAPMLTAGMPVNLRDGKGNSLLMLAAYHGHHTTARLLLDHGADPDLANDRGQTPLGGVAFKGRLDLVRLLVEHDANPNADQGGGRLPIHFAALFGQREVVDYLATFSGVSRRLALVTTITRFGRNLIGK